LRGFRRSDITASTALIVFVAIAVLHVDGNIMRGARQFERTAHQQQLKLSAQVPGLPAWAEGDVC
jgi:hypothetical protein